MQNTRQRQRNTMSIDTMPAAQAVETLITDYGKLVFHVILGLTSDWQESQDLTQDTFVQALRAIDAARSARGAHFHASLAPANCSQHCADAPQAEQHHACSPVLFPARGGAGGNGDRKHW